MTPTHLEQNKGSHNGGNREHDVVYRAHDGGVEDVEGLVEVVHLRDDTDHHNLWRQGKGKGESDEAVRRGGEDDNC